MISSPVFRDETVETEMEVTEDNDDEDTPTEMVDTGPDPELVAERFAELKKFYDKHKSAEQKKRA